MLNARIIGMEIGKIAILLEIIGFSLATLFGAILLSREVAGRWAVRIYEVAEKLRTKAITLYITLAAKIQIEPVRTVFGRLFLMGVAEICIIAGWLSSIAWLFWLGIALLGPFLIMFVLYPFLARTDLLVRVKKRGIWALLALILFQFIFLFLILPVLVFPFLLLFYLFAWLGLILVFSTGKDIVRKTCLILGSVIVIIGLIMEYIISG